MSNQSKPVNPTVKAVLEYGPIVLFFVAYSFFKERTFLVAGTEYSGFVAVTALFIPVLVLATLGMWRLTGRLSKCSWSRWFWWWFLVACRSGSMMSGFSR